MIRRRAGSLDILLIALAGLGLGFWLSASFTSQAGSMASVHIAGEKQLDIDLNRPGVHELAGPLGHSRLEVKDGRLRILEAPCPEQRCRRQGWISQRGESISCIPNRLHVQVDNGDEGYDSLLY